MKYIVIVLTLFILSGCGGSSSGDVDVSTPQNPLFDSLEVGLVGKSYRFESLSGDAIFMSVNDLLLDDNLVENSRYQEIKNFDPWAFSQLHKYVKKSKFIIFWIVPGWQENWFHIEEIQTLIDEGYVPVFNYWYFGDHLIYGLPDVNQQEAYKEDAVRVSALLSQLEGEKMVVLEPEFNKNIIVKDAQTQHQFASILKGAITQLRAENEDLLIGLSMMDTGKRDARVVDTCGYDNCALGDKTAWEKPEIIFNDLLSGLDFVAFNQALASFSRDYDNPGGWDSPNPRIYSNDELGVEYFAQRMVNLTRYLKEKYHRAVFLPYIGIATATWNDTSMNGEVDPWEINKNGWNYMAGNIYRSLKEQHSALEDAGLFGYAPMALFDDPRHDYGGYQYFMNNEYHLGIVATSAVDEYSMAADGNLSFKSDILESLFGSVE